MSKSATFQEQVNVLGVGYTSTRVVTGDNSVFIEPTALIPTAKTGILTTRTNNTDGTLTMDPGHGITTGIRFDLYWSGGSRVGCIAGTVAGNSVPFTLGSGDNLPIATTPIRVGVPAVESGLAIVGANVSVLVAFAILAAADFPGYVVFLTSGDVEIKSYKLTGAVPTRTWDSDYGATNPVTGQTIAKVSFSHGNTDAARDMGAAVLYN
jgi:hypothetical protein